jgi:hypothetical protein
VNREPALGFSAAHTRLRAQVLELRHHVAANERREFDMSAVERVQGLTVIKGCLNVLVPSLLRNRSGRRELRASP